MKILPFFDDDCAAMREKIVDRMPALWQAMLHGIPVRLVDNRRGRAWRKLRLATVPAWAFTDKREGYFEWYVAHELTHFIDEAFTNSRGHTISFGLILKTLTPYAHYELGYRPRGALAAGIGGP